MTLRNFSLSLVALALMIVAAATPAAAGTVQCASYNNQRVNCAADTRNGVAMTQQWSRNPCLKGKTWGIVGDNNIWISQGCRGVFTTGVMPGESPRPPYPQPGPGQNFTCESYNNRRNTCSAPGRGDIRMVRQLSKAPCVRGSSWDTDRNGVWVDRGCRAVFSIGR